MLHLEVLVLKLLPVDRLATSTVPRREVTSLDHEPSNMFSTCVRTACAVVYAPFDDTVESASLIVEGLSSVSYTLLSCAQCPCSRFKRHYLDPHNLNLCTYGSSRPS